MMKKNWKTPILNLMMKIQNKTEVYVELYNGIADGHAIILQGQVAPSYIHLEFQTSRIDENLNIRTRYEYHVYKLDKETIRDIISSKSDDVRKFYVKYFFLTIQDNVPEGPGGSLKAN